VEFLPEASVYAASQAGRLACFVALSFFFFFLFPGSTYHQIPPWSPCISPFVLRSNRGGELLFSFFFFGGGWEGRGKEKETPDRLWGHEFVCGKKENQAPAFLFEFEFPMVFVDALHLRGIGYSIAVCFRSPEK